MPDGLPAATTGSPRGRGDVVGKHGKGKRPAVVTPDRRAAIDRLCASLKVHRISTSRNRVAQEWE